MSMEIVFLLAFKETVFFFLQWFVEGRGKAVGMVMAGHGLGSAIFNPIVTFYLNPDNIPTGKSG